jgi:hypothetical protein
MGVNGNFEGNSGDIHTLQKFAVLEDNGSYIRISADADALH